MKSSGSFYKDPETDKFGLFPELGSFYCREYYSLYLFPHRSERNCTMVITNRTFVGRQSYSPSSEEWKNVSRAQEILELPLLYISVILISSRNFHYPGVV